MQGKIDKRAAFSTTMSGLSSSMGSLVGAGIASGDIGKE